MSAVLSSSLAGAGVLSAYTVRGQSRDQSPILVAYLTRSGNTRVFASTIARQTGASLFEIRTEKPYPEDYEAHVDLARRQLEQLNNWFATIGIEL